MRGWWFLVAALAAACPGGDDDTPPQPDAADCLVGDPGKPLEIEVVLRQVDGTYVVAGEGAQAQIQTPPQAGKVIYPGVRARNVSSCNLQLTTALKDECAGITISVEARPVRLRPTADGWAEPLDPAQISEYGNLPVCPRANATRDLEGESYLLEAIARAPDGRMAMRALHVTPVCGAEPGLEDMCTCECDKDYQLGQACAPEVDGGPVGCAVDAGF
jgi:hypothetical protein